MTTELWADPSAPNGGSHDSETYRSWAALLSPHIVENLAAGGLHSSTAIAEEPRRSALEVSAIIDTAPESRFDEIATLARRRFGVAIAAIGLMDGDMEWFKSISGAEIKSLARKESFCDWTLRGRTALIIPDAQADDRFKNLGLVTAGGIRSYAGHPILDPSGIAVGAICVLDTRPRTFSDEDVSFLRELAALVERLLQTPVSV